MGFISNPEAYDVILLGGRQLPGEVHLGGEVVRELAKQHKRGSGDDGAQAHFRGLKPADFSIIMKLHTDEQEAEWARILPLCIDLSKSVNRNQLSVVHPQLQRLGISQCIIHHVGESPPLNGDPIVVKLLCSSIKVNIGGSHTPRQTRNVVTGAGTATPYRPGLGPLNRYNALPLNVRSASALEQARLDNGIPIDVAMPDTFEPSVAPKTLDEQIAEANASLAASLAGK